MIPLDPTGRLVTTTRDAAAVAAITAIVRGGEKASGDAPPYVVVVPLSAAPALPNGQGRRAGVAGWRHAFRCYGPKVQGGDRQAEALGLAVMTALHNAGPIRYAAADGGRAAIYQIEVEGMGGPIVDPGTGEPYVVVTTSTAAALQSFT